MIVSFGLGWLVFPLAGVRGFIPAAIAVLAAGPGVPLADLRLLGVRLGAQGVVRVAPVQAGQPEAFGSLGFGFRPPAPAVVRTLVGAIRRAVPVRPAVP